MASIFETEIVEELAHEAAFLWIRRDAAARDPSCDLAGLRELDERVEAQLDGLREASAEGWAICRAALDEPSPGAIFAAAVVALSRRDWVGFAEVLRAGGASAALARGIVSALGWMPFEEVGGVLSGLLYGRCPPDLHFLGISGYAAHRRDPGAALEQSLLSDDERLRLRSLRAAGELGRADLLPELRRALGGEDESRAFWAAWSAALLREPAGLGPLFTVACGGGGRAAQAVDLAMRAGDPGDGLARLAALRQSAPLRVTLAAAAALGAPASVPWLIELMEAPEPARAAGFVFSMITGADLAGEALTRPAPAGFRSGPTDDPDDDNVAMDPDEGLPFPDAALVRRWWGRREGAFRPGARYLLGGEISAPRLEEVLRRPSSPQPARAAAAIELCLLSPGRPLFEARAPGFRQAREEA